MIRGSTKPINREFSLNIHNRFDIEVIDSRTGKVRQKAQAYNVICDNYWKFLRDDWAAAKYILYGSGSGVPQTTDTALFKQIGDIGLGSPETGIDYKAGVSYCTRKGVLLETSAVGETITEVGLRGTLYSPYRELLTTHAMLQDMNGNPLSIVKTETDIINFYSTIYVHWKPGGYNGVYFLGSPDSGSLMWKFLGGNTNDSLKYNNQTWFTKGDYGSVSQVDGVYGYSVNDPGAKTWTFTCPRLRASEGNSGGLGWLACGDNTSSSVYYRSTSSFLANLQGAYPIIGETVGTGDGETLAFATAFDLPMDATVYLNGEEVESGVRVNYEPLTVEPMKYFLRIAGVTPEGEIIPHPVIPRRIEANATHYFYNPLHEVGLYSFYNSYSSYTSYVRISVSFSDDMVNWSPSYTAYQDNRRIIPEAYRHCKYVRIVGGSSGSSQDYNYGVKFYFSDEVVGKPIVFDEAPPVGSVITIDYTTPMVPKDENHVYDFKLVVHYGEYSEEQG